jgi:hypothetical protein
MPPKLWAAIAEPTLILNSKTLNEYIGLLYGFLTHPKRRQNSYFWPSNVKLTPGCTSVPGSRLIEKINPNRTTSRLLHCPNGRRLLLNAFNSRWRSNAVGGPSQCLREQVGLRPKLRCAPPTMLKTWSFLTENILKREKPNAGENSLKSRERQWSTRFNYC